MIHPTEISGKYDLSGGVFQSVATRYDRTNSLISLGLNGLWQRELVREVQRVPHITILDVACGTGVLTRRLSRLKETHVTGIDSSEAMLAVACTKGQAEGRPLFLPGFAQELPLPDCSFKVVTVAFGLRNFADRGLALQQMHRVLEPGGKVFILEFSLQAAGTGYAGNFLPLQRMYVRHIIPLLGWLGTGDKKAYKYLSDSVTAFPHPVQLCDEMNDVGFRHVTYRRLLPGVVVLFTGEKK